MPEFDDDFPGVFRNGKRIGNVLRKQRNKMVLIVSMTISRKSK